MTTMSPSPFRVMKIGSLESWARFEISLALFLKSEIGLITGILTFLSVDAKLYHLSERVKPGTEGWIELESFSS